MFKNVEKVIILCMHAMQREYVFKSLENLKNVRTALYTIIQID